MSKASKGRSDSDSESERKSASEEDNYDQEARQYDIKDDDKGYVKILKERHSHLKKTIHLQKRGYDDDELNAEVRHKYYTILKSHYWE